MINSTMLSELMKGRNNNFDFLRFFAASLVVFCHSFMFSPPGSLEPLSYISNGSTNFGKLAVSMFFVISGFLITQSYENTISNRAFLLKRCLRILPGLAVATLFCMLVVGPIFSSYEISTYFSEFRTYTFLSNIFLRMQRDLPGVFNDNPLPGNVNGSLWTLWYEFVCYLGVLGLGLAGQLRRKSIILILCAFFFITINWANVPVMWRVNEYLSMLRWQEEYIELIPYFASGSLLYLLRDKIPISPVLAIVAFLILLFTLRTSIYNQIFTIAGSYLIIYFAYSSSLQLGHFTKRGDYSYGIYIYAFPVQQIISQILELNNSWMINFAVSYPIILLCAVFSWHWVESPALAMKRRYLKPDKRQHPKQDRRQLKLVGE